MLSDPENKDYILLETDKEAQAAFDVGYITRDCYYVYRQFPYPFETITLMREKKFIRVLRNEEKIKEMMKLLESK